MARTKFSVRTSNASFIDWNKFCDSHDATEKLFYTLYTGTPGEQLLKTIEDLKNEGADFNKIIGQYTPIRVLATRERQNHRNHHIVLKKLIELGAEVNSPDDIESYIYGFSSFDEYWEIIELLIENKIDLNHRGSLTTFTFSPILPIVRRLIVNRQRPHQEIIRKLSFLLKHGADFTFRNSQRKHFFEEISRYSPERAPLLDSTLISFLKLCINMLICFRVLFCKVISHKNFPPKFLLKEIILLFDEERSFVTPQLFESILFWAQNRWEPTVSALPFFEHILPQMKAKYLVGLIEKRANKKRNLEEIDEEN